MKNNSKIAIAALATAGLVGLAGCASPDAGSSDSAGSGEKTDITLAVFNGWDEGVATSWLWKTILEDEGYSVELEYADPAPVFEGLSSGDYDFTTDVWLPEHARRVPGDLRRGHRRTRCMERRVQAHARRERRRTDRHHR